MAELRSQATRDANLLAANEAAYAGEAPPLEADAPAPLAQDDVFAGPESQALVLRPLDNDQGSGLVVTHVAGQTILVGQTVQLAGVGSIRLNADQTLTFTPVQELDGRQTFSYAVRASDGGTDEGMIHVDLAGLTAGVDLTIPPPAPLLSPITLITAAAPVESIAHITGLAGGGHVIVWQGRTGSGPTSTTSTFARVFNGQGVATTGELTLAAGADTVHVARSASGGFIVAYETSTGISVRPYSAGGAPLAAATQIATWTTNVQSIDDLIELTNGQVVALYRLAGQSYVQLMSATGAPVGPAVHVGGNGKFDLIPSPHGGYAIVDNALGGHLTFVDAAGVVGPRTLLGSVGTGGDIAFAWLPDGTAIAVLQQSLSNRFTVQRVDADGDPIGSPVTAINDTGSYRSLSPNMNIVPLADGGFVLVWNREAYSGGIQEVVAQRFDALLQPVGAAFVVSNPTNGAEDADIADGRSVTVAPNGDLIVVFEEGDAVYSRRIGFPTNATGDEDTSLPISVNFTQVDPTERGQLLIEGVPEGATLSAGQRQSDGSWLVDRAGLPGLTMSAPDLAGTFQLRLTAFTDGDLAHGVTRSYGVTFLARPDAPRAQNDVFTTPEDLVVILNPLANDREVDGETMTLTHLNGTAIAVGQTVQLAGAGSLRLNADGSLTFTPVADWSGERTFTYTVRDASGATATATATLQVAGVTDGATFTYGQLANWTPTAIDAADVRVNATTAGAQTQSSIAALTDGGYLITWVSVGQDGSGAGVFARRYDSNGQAVGGEFQVNQLTAGDQQHTAILALADGGWVIAWSGPAPTGSTTAVYARRYAADGSATQTHLVTDAAFNTQFYSGTAYNQGAPTLAAGPDGGFVIGWTTFFSASDNDIWLRRYAADGTLLGGHWVESGATLEDHLAIVRGANGQIFAIHQEVDGYYNGPTSGWDRDYGIYLERHGPNGALGDPVQLNTVIAGNQTNPTLAVLANGDMVAAWQSSDGSGTGIVFRVLNVDGEPILAERWANQTKAGAQSSPSIVALADGTFVILWASAGQDGSGAGIYGQRVSADGTLYLGGEFRLNATTTGDQTLDSAVTDVSFAVLEDGTLVATWWGDGEVHHRRFDPPEAAFTAYQGEVVAIPLTLTLLDASETFELAISNLPPGATLSAGTQRADGSWLVTAAEAASLSLTPPTGYAGDMLLRIEITTVDGESRATATSYRSVRVLPVDNDADGARVRFRTGTDAFTTQDVPLTDVNGADYQDPSIAALAGGRYVLTWSDSFGDVNATLYEYDGRQVPVGDFWSWFQVNVYETGDQSGPSPVALPDGGFMIFWHSYGQDGSEFGIYGQRFDVNGGRVGGEFRVNTTTARTQEAPAVAVLEDGGFVVVFESQPADGQFELRGQRYGADGGPSGSEFLIRSASAAGNQRWPDVSALDGGGFVVVWTSFETDGSGSSIDMRLFDARGDANIYRINQLTAGSQQEVKVTTLADGAYLVTWTTFADQPGATNGVQARRFHLTEDGLVGSSEFSVSAGLSGAHGDPDVVALPDGGFIVVWNRSAGGDVGDDILAQRYDAEGRRLGSAFQVNVDTFGDQGSHDLYADPMATLDHNGDLLVVWHDGRDGNIYSRRFEIDPDPPFVGEVGEPIAVAIAVEARDASETVEIVLSNVPEGSVLSAGARQVDGRWLLAPADLAGLTLTTPSSYVGSGFDLIVTVTTRQGNDSFTTVAYQTVQVRPAPPGMVLAGTEGADVLAGGGGGDTIAGLAGDDALAGGRGDDVLTGGLGADSLNGGEGQDTAVFAGARAESMVRQNLDGSFTVSGPDGTDTLTAVEFVRFGDQTEQLYGESRAGTAGGDVLAGTARGDILAGLEGDDTLRGGAGADVLNGGGGVDTADYSTAAGGVTARLDQVEAAIDGDGGADTLSSIENLTGSAFNDTLVGDANANILRGGLGADTILGLAGNDVLWGGSGAVNQLQGGLGDDRYVLEAADVVLEAAGEGNDTVEARINAYVLAANIETLIFAGVGAFSATGNAQNNSITGGAGDDVLRGRGGVDILNGGAGIDTADYSLAAAGMRAQLNSNSSSNDGDGGTDTFVSIENLTGSAFNDTLIGDGVANVLRGGLGADTILGLAGADVIWGGSGVVNQLQGGLGDDRYILEANDSVVEVAGEGNDTVEARINAYVLALNVENLVFGGTGNFAATGNAQANAITGGAGDDNLRGRGGVDVLNGGAGTDTVDYTLAAAGVTARLDTNRATNDGDGATDTFTGVENLTGSVYNDLLIGNAGNNVLHGGIGTDTLLGFGGDDILWGGSGGGNNQLQGGTGNDYYVLDAFDTCVELAGEGVDTVEARIGSYTMGANIENLLYVGGTGTFVGTGNALDNQITGGNGNDILRGRGGNDTINGGLGKDEIQMRGLAADYTVTVEGAGYRIVDKVAGRDGSTFVTSIEVIRWSNNAVRTLSYPPVAASIGEAGKNGPEVSPLPADDLLGKDGDAFVLPALADDMAQVLPGLDAAKGFDGFEVLPAISDRLFLGLEARMAQHDGWMRMLDHDGVLALREDADWL